jgi:hypothetical protein
MKNFMCKHFGHSWGNSNAIEALMIMAAVELKNNMADPLMVKCDRCGAERDLKQEIISAIERKKK